MRWHGRPMVGISLWAIVIARSRYGIPQRSVSSSPIVVIPAAYARWPGRLMASASPRRATIIRYACGKQYESMVLEVTLPFSLRAEMWYAEISVLFVLLMANLSHILLKANKKGLSIASI